MNRSTEAVVATSPLRGTPSPMQPELDTSVRENRGAIFVVEMAVYA